MPFELMKLPFAKSALEPTISAETIEFHHGKHHAAYVKKVNALLGEHPAPDGSTLTDIIRSAQRDGNKGLFNNAAQIWNHNVYWHSLSPKGGVPEGELEEMIASAFGSSADLLKAMKEEAVGHFSNGWVWLVVENGKLAVKSYHDADTPLVHEGVKPLLTLDVWEHAYYIDYRNARPDYAEATLSELVNWKFAAENLERDGIAAAEQRQDALEDAAN